MAFALLIYPPEGADLSTTMRRGLHDWLAHLEAKNLLIFHSPMHPPGAANYVECQAGTPVMVEGPVSNELHVVCGAEFVRCKTMAEAMELASHHPALEIPGVKVEVRQMWHLEDLD